jgi:hypothetical protein
LALALTAIVLLRQRYSCVIPTEHVRFFLLCVLFLFGFVGFVAEVVSAYLARSGAAGLRLRIATVAAGLFIYAAIGGIAWIVNPVPSDQEDDAPYRATLSIFWSAGLLQETGAYSNYACGY